MITWELFECSGWLERNFVCVHELYCLFWSFIFVGAFYLDTAATYALQILHLGLVPVEYIKYIFIAKSFIFINAPTCYLINSFFFPLRAQQVAWTFEKS